MSGYLPQLLQFYRRRSEFYVYLCSMVLTLEHGIIAKTLLNYTPPQQRRLWNSGGGVASELSGRLGKVYFSSVNNFPVQAAVCAGAASCALRAAHKNLVRL